MKYLVDFIKGIGIGAGCILPGISSGVLLVIFGLYEKLIDCILHFFKDVRKNVSFLFPIALGTLLGMVLFRKSFNIFVQILSKSNKICFYGAYLRKSSYTL